jgi:hypothetical protein
VKNRTQHFETDVPLPAEGEFVIVLDPTRRRDEHGRVRFTTFWFDPKTPMRVDRTTTCAARFPMPTPTSTCGTSTAPARPRFA